MLTPLTNSEWATRRSLIDPKLNARGWKVANHVATSAEVPPGTSAAIEYPTTTGLADYALCAGGRIIGIVEAKKLTVSPQGVLTQAQRYAEGVANSPFNFRGLRVPFLYSTNGEIIHFHDIRDPLNLSRTVKHFHTPAALEEMLGRDFGKACEWFTANPNNHHWLRAYQKEANAAVEKAITQRKRNMLLAMATGTGKTVTLVNQVYRLIKSGVARRVLFLVDRRALAAQAVKTFAAFEPEPNQKFNAIYDVYSQRFKREDFDEDEKFDPTVLPADYLLNPQAKHTFVYVCTIQRMAINLFGRSAVWSGEGDEIDDDADQLDIPIHAFDVIVADECHRGYLQHYLTLMQGEEVSTNQLFSTFRAFVRKEPVMGAVKHIERFPEYAKQYRSFSEYPDTTREGIFFQRLMAMEMTTLFPILMEVFRRLSAPADQPALTQILDDLESFLVRRTICGLTTKSYTRFFAESIKKLWEWNDFSAPTIRRLLLDQTAEASRWPDDSEFKADWMALKIYKRLSRARTRMILEALNRKMQASKTEALHLTGTLSIEHLLPQAWQKHWPLPTMRPAADGAALQLEPEEAEDWRNDLLHTIGNLTLVTEELNSSISNGSWAPKKAEILRHSALNLNRGFQDVTEWNERAIIQRSEELFEVARTIWPRPVLEPKA